MNPIFASIILEINSAFTWIDDPRVNIQKYKGKANPDISRPLRCSPARHLKGKAVITLLQSLDNAANGHLKGAPYG